MSVFFFLRANAGSILIDAAVMSGSGSLSANGGSSGIGCGNAGWSGGSGSGEMSLECVDWLCVGCALAVRLLCIVAAAVDVSCVVLLWPLQCNVSFAHAYTCIIPRLLVWL